MNLTSPQRRLLLKESDAEIRQAERAGNYEKALKLRVINGQMDHDDIVNLAWLGYQPAITLLSFEQVDVGIVDNWAEYFDDTYHVDHWPEGARIAMNWLVREFTDNEEIINTVENGSVEDKNRLTRVLYLLSIHRAFAIADLQPSLENTAESIYGIKTSIVNRIMTDIVRFSRFYGANPPSMSDLLYFNNNIEKAKPGLLERFKKYLINAILSGEVKYNA